MSKQSYRKLFRENRKKFHLEKAEQAKNGLKSLLLKQFTDGKLLSERNVLLAGYWPIYSEIDPIPSLNALALQDLSLCLPSITEEHKALTFRLWQPGASLEKGHYGISVPLESEPLVSPNVLLVPLLAFTRKGERLGYGGGYYDRTLLGLRSEKNLISIGLAFSGQESDSLPSGEFDQKLDFVCTEKEWIVCS